jgi:hypothetical protein|tara:strand:+ start:381 stop:737 length:357 start_codon:yes stop_codon:yes gene_type:complete
MLLYNKNIREESRDVHRVLANYPGEVQLCLLIYLRAALDAEDAWESSAFQNQRARPEEYIMLMEVRRKLREDAEDFMQRVIEKTDEDDQYSVVSLAHSIMSVCLENAGIEIQGFANKN